MILTESQLKNLIGRLIMEADGDVSGFLKDESKVKVYQKDASTPFLRATVSGDSLYTSVWTGRAYGGLDDKKVLDQLYRRVGLKLFLFAFLFDTDKLDAAQDPGDSVKDFMKVLLSSQNFSDYVGDLTLSELESFKISAEGEDIMSPAVEASSIEEGDAAGDDDIFSSSFEPERFGTVRLKLNSIKISDIRPDIVSAKYPADTDARFEVFIRRPERLVPYEYARQTTPDPNERMKMAGGSGGGAADLRRTSEYGQPLEAKRAEIATHIESSDAPNSFFEYIRSANKVMSENCKISIRVIEPLNKAEEKISSLIRSDKFKVQIDNDFYVYDSDSKKIKKQEPEVPAGNAKKSKKK
jgi:hypothetical protein